jgi:hypothetical protein
VTFFILGFTPHFLVWQMVIFLLLLSLTSGSLINSDWDTSNINSSFVQEEESCISEIEANTIDENIRKGAQLLSILYTHHDLADMRGIKRLWGFSQYARSKMQFDIKNQKDEEIALIQYATLLALTMPLSESQAKARIRRAVKSDHRYKTVLRTLVRLTSLFRFSFDFEITELKPGAIDSFIFVLTRSARESQDYRPFIPIVQRYAPRKSPLPIEKKRDRRGLTKASTIKLSR